MPMTKQQMQKWILGAIGGAIGFFAAIQFVVAPMLGSVKDNRANAQSLREQLDKSREVIGKGSDIQRSLVQTRGDIRALAKNIPLPVLGNYLLGMEQKIRSCCAGLNMQINNVAEYDVLDVAGWNSLFKIYRVRVAGKAGINDLARCLYAIQKHNPLVSVMAINIVPQDGIPDSHNVTFVVAWLIWANPDKRPDYLLEPEKRTPTNELHSASTGAVTAAASKPAEKTRGPP
jgi:hypothetical protein